MSAPSSASSSGEESDGGVPRPARLSCGDESDADAQSERRHVRQQHEQESRWSGSRGAMLAFKSARKPGAPGLKRVSPLSASSPPLLTPQQQRRPPLRHPVSGLPNGNSDASTSNRSSIITSRDATQEAPLDAEDDYSEAGAARVLHTPVQRTTSQHSSDPEAAAGNAASAECSDDDAAAPSLQRTTFVGTGEASDDARASLAAATEREEGERRLALEAQRLHEAAEELQRREDLLVAREGVVSSGEAQRKIALILRDQVAERERAVELREAALAARCAAVDEEVRSGVQEERARLGEHLTQAVELAQTLSGEVASREAALASRLHLVEEREALVGQQVASLREEYDRLVGDLAQRESALVAARESLEAGLRNEQQAIVAEAERRAAQLSTREAAIAAAALRHVEVCKEREVQLLAELQRREQDHRQQLRLDMAELESRGKQAAADRETALQLLASREMEVATKIAELRELEAARRSGDGGSSSARSRAPLTTDGWRGSGGVEFSGPAWPELGGSSGSSHAPHPSVLQSFDGSGGGGANASVASALQSPTAAAPSQAMHHAHRSSNLSASGGGVSSSSRLQAVSPLAHTTQPWSPSAGANSAHGAHFSDRATPSAPSPSLPAHQSWGAGVGGSPGGGALSGGAAQWGSSVLHPHHADGAALSPALDAPSSSSGSVVDWKAYYESALGLGLAGKRTLSSRSLLGAPPQPAQPSPSSAALGYSVASTKDQLPQHPSPYRLQHQQWAQATSPTQGRGGDVVAGAGNFSFTTDRASALPTSSPFLLSAQAELAGALAAISASSRPAPASSKPVTYSAWGVPIYAASSTPESALSSVWPRGGGGGGYGDLAAYPYK